MALVDSARDLASKVTLPRVVPHDAYDVREVGLGWEIAPIAGQAADTITTALALRKGYREANPIVAHVAGNLTAFAGVKLALAILQHIAVRGLAKTGHPKLARIVSALSFASGVVPAAMNVRTMTM